MSPCLHSPPGSSGSGAAHSCRGDLRNSELRAGRHTGDIRSCPQLTTFLGKGAQCPSVLSVFCAGHSHTPGEWETLAVKPQQVPGVSDPLLSLRKALCTISLLPLRSPHCLKNSCILWFWNVWKPTAWIQIFPQNS